MTDDEFWLEALKEYLYEHERQIVGFMYQGSYRYVGIYWASTPKGPNPVPMWLIGASTHLVPPSAAKELLLSRHPTFDIEMFKLGRELTHG